MRTLAIAILSVFAALDASAQLATDLVPHERTISRAAAIQQELADSRYHLGPFRLRPRFVIRDLGYDNNVFGTAADQAVDDWHTTIGAGANVILPLGNKMYLTGVVLPEYTYYQKLTDRRLLGGEYAGSLITLFNRLSVETGGSLVKTIAPVSSELETSAPSRRADIFARSEIDIFRRLALFGSAHQQQQRYELTDADRAGGATLDQLERDETFIRGGIRYRLRSYIDVSIAAENGTTEFVSQKQSNNKTQAVLLGIRYERPRFFLNAAGGERTGDARGDSNTFPHYSTTTASYYAAYQLGVPLSVDAYGHRSVVYGLYPGNPYFFETRNGAGFTIPVGERLGFRAFGEKGTNAYPVVSVDTVKRTDDVSLVGGGIAFRVYRKVVMTILASQTRYTSNVDVYSRSIFRLATVLSMNGDFFR